MQIYLTHPRHGKKIAHLEKEAEADKKAGWKEVTEAEFFPKPKAPEPVIPAPFIPEHKPTGQDANLVAQYEIKHGKKPHHRMTNDSIREALNDPATA